jgi:uncharacterized protein YndB with AHSA1/START domain
MTTSLKFVQSIRTTPAQVYRAFTNSTALREWLCDAATVSPRAGGRFYVAWNSGYYAFGEYLKLQPDKQVDILWQGRDEPAATRLVVTINALDDGSVTLVLEHLGLESTPQWQKAQEEISEGWNSGLKNLLSVLEEGSDLRIVNRPMMGITFGEFNAKRAQELGIPVTEGVRLEGVINGMGAQSAGLGKNDVIVAMDGRTITEFSNMIAFLEKHRAGDKIEVGFYRRNDKKRVTMELSRRPLPEIPSTRLGLADALRRIYQEGDAELDKALQGVTDEEATFHPGPDEWNVKETLAHLIQGERDTHAWVSDQVFSEERVSDGFTDNLNARIRATVSAYGTLAALREELRRNEAETIAMLANLPSEVETRKSTMWKIGYNLLQDPFHTKEHAEQIRTAAEAARK